MSILDELELGVREYSYGDTVAVYCDDDPFLSVGMYLSRDDDTGLIQVAHHGTVSSFSPERVRSLGSGIQNSVAEEIINHALFPFPRAD
jgi:hypothetical protein